MLDPCRRHIILRRAAAEAGVNKPDVYEMWWFGNLRNRRNCVRKATGIWPGINNENRASLPRDNFAHQGVRLLTGYEWLDTWRTDRPFVQREATQQREDARNTTPPGFGAALAAMLGRT